MTTTAATHAAATGPGRDIPSGQRWLALAVLCSSLLIVTLAVSHVILGSLGGALEVAGRVGGSLGAALAGAARSAFVSGMGLGMTVAAIVAIVGFLVALATLPGRPPRQTATSRARQLHGQG